MPNEGPETFSPYDGVGHLIHGEATDWTAPGKMILEFGPARTFERWNRNSHVRSIATKDDGSCSDTFSAARKNMDWFRG